MTPRPSRCSFTHREGAIELRGPTLHPRLQLAVGSWAQLDEQLDDVRGCRVFAAHSRDGNALRRVLLHPPPPAGIEPGLLLERVNQLRALDHPGLVLPIAVGELEGSTWVVEPISLHPVGASHDFASKRLSLSRGIAMMRDITRALAAMHRRGITHGAIDLDTIDLDPRGTRLLGLGLSPGATPRADIDAATIACWTLVTSGAPGPAPPRLSSLRRGVPRQLDALFAELLAADPSDRPESAEVVLGMLDALPARRGPGAHPGHGSGARPHRPRAGFVVLLVIALVIVLVIALV